MSSPWPELERRLRREVPLRVRRYAEDLMTVDPTLAPEFFDDLLAETVKLLGLLDGRADDEPAPRGEGSESGVSSQEARHWAISEVLSAAAAEDEEVIAFRDEVLGGTFLAWSDVEAWIKRRAKVDGDRTTRTTATWVSADEDHPDPWWVPQRSPDSLERSVDFLAYSVPDDAWRRIVVTNELGVLGRLRRLSERLAVEYTWQPGQATVFVLTGLTAQTAALRVTTPGIVPIAKGRAQPWRQRIVLHVDLTVDPDDVKGAFIRARAEVLGRGLRGKRHRARLLSERAYRLAVHVAQRPAGERWRQTMERWDEAHPEWRYGDRADPVRQFRAEATRAIDRTLDPFG